MVIRSQIGVAVLLLSEIQNMDNIFIFQKIYTLEKNLENA